MFSCEDENNAADTVQLAIGDDWQGVCVVVSDLHLGVYS